MAQSAKTNVDVNEFVVDDVHETLGFKYKDLQALIKRSLRAQQIRTGHAQQVLSAAPFQLLNDEEKEASVSYRLFLS